MPLQAIQVIPPPEHPGSIAPNQVWASLNAQQQQQIRQTLITIIQQSLTPLTISAVEDLSNES